MFKKIIALAFIVPSLGSAQIGKQLLKQIEKVNDGGLGVPKQTNPCDNCSKETSPAAVLASCVRQVCTDKGLLTYDESPKLDTVALFNEAPQENEIVDSLNKMMNVSDSANLQEMKNKIIADLRSGKLALNDDNLEIAFQFLAIMAGSKAIEWNKETYRAEFSESKFDISKLPLSAKNKAALKLRAKAFVKGLPSAVELAGDNYANTDAYLAAKYPGRSRADAVKTMVADFKVQYAEYKSEGIGKLISKMSETDVQFPAELVADIESGKDISDMDVKDLIAARNTFSSNKKYFASGAGVGSDQVDFEDLRNRLKNPSIVEKYVAKDKKREADKYMLQSDARASCIGRLRVAMQMLPTKEQLGTLKNSIAEVKKDIAANWGGKYSEQTQKKINQYIQEVSFSMPVTKDEFVSGLKQRISRETQKQIRNSQAQIKDADTAAFLMALMSYMSDLKDPSEKEEDNEYKEICAKESFSPLNDANYTMLGKIQVSYTLAHATESAKGVLAHEIGHGISQLFKSKQASEHSSKKHQGYLNCLTSLHESNGSQYNEEDYADFVAANTTKSNFACLFPVKYSETNLLDNPKDDHSTDFFRLMHIESLQRGSLPDECNTVLVEQRAAKDYSACQRLLSAPEAVR